MKPRPVHAAAAVIALFGVPAAVVAQQPDGYTLPAASPQPPAGAPLAPLEPKAALRKTLVARTTRGTVTYRMPGEDSDRELPDRPTSLPMKVIIDTTEGRVKLTVARDSKRTSSGIFFDGRFRASQGAGARPITHLRLVGEIPGCASTSARTAATRKRRRLWGDGKGRFRTRGRYSAATVRGTKWLVEDRCDGTLTRVARGVVDVDDLAPVARGQQPAAPAPAPDSGGEGAPSPQTSPQALGNFGGSRRVRLRKGGTYVARPG